MIPPGRLFPNEVTLSVLGLVYSSIFLTTQLKSQELKYISSICFLVKFSIRFPSSLQDIQSSRLPCSIFILLSLHNILELCLYVSSCSLDQYLFKTICVHISRAKLDIWLIDDIQCTITGYYFCLNLFQII